MKITQTNVGTFRGLDSARPAQRSEQASKAFSLKPKGETATTARAEVKPSAAESPVSVALRSVAADYKAGRIPDRQEAVRKMVSTMLREQYGPAVAKDPGFQKMEQSISDLISDDPMLSKRMENLLGRLA
jgi:hypothetical protein